MRIYIYIIVYKYIYMYIYIMLLILFIIIVIDRSVYMKTNIRYTSIMHVMYIIMNMLRICSHMPVVCVLTYVRTAICACVVLFFILCTQRPANFRSQEAAGWSTQGIASPLSEVSVTWQSYLTLGPDCSFCRLIHCDVWYSAAKFAQVEPPDS